MYDIIVGRSDEDKEKYGTRGAVLLAKHYVKMGQTTSLSNKVYMDITRSHVMLVCGKRGGGKCLTGDTLITLEDGREVEIKELENETKNIISLDLGLVLKNKKKEGFYKRNVNKLLKIKLSSGKEIKLTPEHPLLTKDGWKEAQNININDEIATPKQLSFFGKNILTDAEIKKSLCTEKVPNIIFMSTKSTIANYLKKIFSTNGKIDQNNHSWNLTYNSNNTSFLKQIQSLLLKFGILSQVSDSSISIKQEQLYNYIQEIGVNSKNKEIATKLLKEIITLKPIITTNYSNTVEISNGSNQKLLINTKLKNSNSYNSDINWDKLEYAETLNGDFEVYDITVPETHNFVANNIIVHNSYTLGVIAEGLSDIPKEIANNLAIVLVDTMGIYWTMKYPNKKDDKLLKEWGFDAKGLDVKIYTPEEYYYKYKEQKIPTDFPFTVAVSDLSGTDWCLTFEFNDNDPYGVLIDKVVNELHETEKEYDLDDIIKGVEADDSSEKYVKAAVINHFNNAKEWGVFKKNGTHLKDIVKAGQVTVLDVSCYATHPNGWNIKALVLALVSQKLFTERMIARKEEELEEINNQVRYFGAGSENKKQEPLVWIVVDEAHEFLPREGKTVASQPLITILREGRQPGISLILATQQPGKIHTDVMTQSDIVLSHRITARIDTDALSVLMQSYMRKGLDEELDGLPRVQGAGIIFDDTNEKMYPVRIRPRFTWHGGSSPTAMTDKKGLDDF